MSNRDYPLSKNDFDAIYAKVPRLTVDLILTDHTQGTFMTRRDIDPCKGQWHIPGGTVYFGETLEIAVKRIAQRELGIRVEKIKLSGYIDYPSHYMNNLDSPVSIVFEIINYSGSIRLNKESSRFGWFTKLPKNTHADQDDFLIAHRYLSR